MRNHQELCTSQEDWDRLKVLYAVEKGPLTHKQSGLQLRLRERRVQKLLACLRQEGDKGIVHRLLGRASKWQLPEAVQERVANVRTHLKT